MLKRVQLSLAFLAFLGIAFGSTPLPAQEPASAPPPAAPLLSPEQLDKLLAPIALYPDPLIAQILPASTDPSDIVLAARYVKAQKDPNQIDAQPWEESVKALARYPDVLKRMDEQLEWTTQVGEAFIAQPSDVFASIQRLRAQAQSVGNLKTTPQQVVTTEQNVIQIMPSDPQVIYVPQYSPQVVYVQQPVDVVTPLITFGAGLALGAWIHNSCNWNNGNIYYNNNGWNGNHPNGGWNNTNININNNNNINVGNGNGNGGSVWKPQNKPRPTPYNPGNANRPGGAGNPGNRPGGAGNGQGLPGNSTGRPGNGTGNGGIGNSPGKPSQLPATGNNRPSGNGERPSTQPARNPEPGSGSTRQFDREGSKPSHSGAANRPAQASRPTQASRPAQASRQAPAARQAPAGGGGGGGGRR